MHDKVDAVGSGGAKTDRWKQLEEYRDRLAGSQKGKQQPQDVE